MSLYPADGDHKMAKPIKTYYYNPNIMGDLLNELLIPKITSRSIEQCLNPMRFDLMGIGSCGSSVWANRFAKPSLAERSKDCIKIVGGKLNHKPCAVWGTGFIRDYTDRNLILIRNNISFIAVRGALSKNIIEKSLGSSIDPVLCDGGILASELISEPINKRYRIGFIPHFKEHRIASEIGLIQLLDQMDDAIMIDLRNEPISVIKQIAGCEYIVSSSLHGCIVADSFHIPNIRVRISDIPGSGFKFDDYYSGFGIECPALIIKDASDFPDPRIIKDKYQIDAQAVEKKKEDMAKCLKRFIVENEL